MERIVEDTWMELESENRIEFACDEYERIALFSRKLNKMSFEACMQNCSSKTQKHSGNILFPGDILFAYNACLKAKKRVYIVVSNLCIQFVEEGTHNWKKTLHDDICMTERGCVRGFYEYMNNPPVLTLRTEKEAIASMRELTLEEITEIINEGDEE